MRCKGEEPRGVPVIVNAYSTSLESSAPRGMGLCRFGRVELGQTGGHAQS